MINLFMSVVVGFEAGLSTPSLSFLHVRFMMDGAAQDRIAFLFTLLLSIAPLVNTADLSQCSSTDQTVHFRILGLYVGDFSQHRKFPGQNLGALKFI